MVDEVNTQEPFALFERGDRGEGVRELQERLADQGFDVGDVDGIFGRKTLAAATEYQNAAGLQQTGVLDGATYNSLLNSPDSTRNFITDESAVIAQEQQAAERRDAITRIQNENQDQYQAAAGLSPDTASDFITSFVDRMAEAEGTEDHQADEGQFTYAYGILPATARSYGISPDDYSNRREFAEAVYGRMNDQAREDYSGVFNGLSNEDSIAVLSTYINLGRLPTGVVDALSGETKDFQAAGRSLTNVIHFTNRQSGVKYSSKGVSARRAGEYNTLMAGQEGFSPVTQVQVTGTRQRPTFNWLDADGTVVETFTSSSPLAPRNSTTTVAVN